MNPRRPPRNRGQWPRSAFRGLATLLACVALCLPTPVVRAQPADAPAEARYEEAGYGVSFAPPAGAARYEEPADGSLAIWRQPDGTTLSFRIAEANFDVVTVEVLLNNVLNDLGFLNAEATFAEMEKRPIAGRPGGVQHVALNEVPTVFEQLARHNKAAPGEVRARWYVAVAVMRLDPQATAVWQVIAPLSRKDRARAELKQLLDSAAVMSFVDLERRRGEQLRNAQQWLAGLPTDRREALAAGDQWFRVVDDAGREDLGFLHRRIVTDPNTILAEGFVPAVDGGVLVVDRLVMPPRGPDGRPIEQLWQVYTSGDRRTEVWSLKTTLFPARRAGLPGAGAAPPPAVWVQTGSRDQRDLTALTEEPPNGETLRAVMQAEQFRGELAARPLQGRFREQFWVLPETIAGYWSADGEPDAGDTPPPLDPLTVYLTLADQLVLDSRLPRDRPADLAFYAFDATTETLGLRTATVTPRPDGGFRVDTRPTPTRGVISSIYDPQGRLVEQRRPDGLRLLAAPHTDIIERWSARAR